MRAQERYPKSAHEDEEPVAIDVIIPLYNGAPWICEAIDSVLSQDVLPDKVVVVDDGSTDASPELVRAYLQVELVTNPGKGSSAARNVGVLRTHSPFVAFLDQDDVWHPSHLRLLVQALGRHPNASAAFAVASSFEHGAPEYSIPPMHVTFFDPWAQFPFTVGVDGPSLALIRRSALEKAGMWDVRATNMGDPLLFLKFAVLSPLLRLTCRTVGKRVHPGQLWLKVREQGTAYLDFRSKVMRLALDFRRQQLPSDPTIEAYRRRLDSLRILRDLTAAIRAEDLREVPRLGHELEHKLFGEAPELIRHAFYCLMGALFAIHDSERLRVERDRVFSGLLEAWPKDASQTRTVLQGLIGEKPRVS